MLSKQDLELRAQLWNEVTSSIKKFFDARGYLSVQTPLIVASPGMEPNLNPVEVEVRTTVQSHRGALITSPEYSMKKLLGAGLEKIYCLTPVFRNVEKMGERWSVEFSMIEWYQQGKDYVACMQETEELVNSLLDTTPPTPPYIRGGSKEGVWPRISYIKDFETRFGVHPDKATVDQLLELCQKHSVEANVAEPAHEIVDRLYNSVAMPELIAKHDRFFVSEYPVICASLAKKSPNGDFAERFEGHVQGLEICNGFTELVDPDEQRRRFLLEAEERRATGKEVYPIDEELLSGLASIASPTYGNALGVDRLVMLKAGVKDIDSIHIFPPSQRF